MDETNREQSAAHRGAHWLLGLGCLLAALGMLREPAHSQQDGGGAPSQPTVSMPSMPGGTVDSNGRMIAVTSPDITGSSLLYVIDTLDRHIAVYQATGGSSGMNSIKLIAARRIDLDLKLDGFNDKSQHSFKDLEKAFIDRGLAPPQRQ